MGQEFTTRTDTLRESGVTKYKVRRKATTKKSEASMYDLRYGSQCSRDIMQGRGSGHTSKAKSVRVVISINKQAKVVAEEKGPRKRNP